MAVSSMLSSSILHCPKIRSACSQGACRRAAPKPWLSRPFLEGSPSSVLCSKNVDGFEPLPRTRNVSVQALFGRKKAAPKVVRETIIPEPDYRIPIVLLGTAGALAYGDNLLPAAPIGLLGLLLLFQTTRVRFVFDDEGLEVKVGNELDESGENVFVGGKNRWRLLVSSSYNITKRWGLLLFSNTGYSSFVNWELWWPNFPVLVYFKETQTKPEGQIHFFPVIFNGKQLYDVMVERAGPSKTSGPK